jgi:hypothetical protein
VATQLRDQCGVPGGHGGGYTGTPPPPLALPGPTRPYGQHFIAFSGGVGGGGETFCGTGESAWQVGQGGGGSRGAALAAPAADAGTAIPTPVATIAAAIASRIAYIGASPPGR